MTRSAYQPEGRQAKSVAHRTDYEEANGLAEIQWLPGISSDNNRLGKRRGSSPKGAGGFSAHFWAAKSGPAGGTPSPKI